MLSLDTEDAELQGVLESYLSSGYSLEDLKSLGFNAEEAEKAYEKYKIKQLPQSPIVPSPNEDLSKKTSSSAEVVEPMLASPVNVELLSLQNKQPSSPAPLVSTQSTRVVQPKGIKGATVSSPSLKEVIPESARKAHTASPPVLSPRRSPHRKDQRLRKIDEDSSDIADLSPAFPQANLQGKDGNHIARQKKPIFSTVPFFTVPSNP